MEMEVEVKVEKLTIAQFLTFQMTNTEFNHPIFFSAQA